MSFVHRSAPEAPHISSVDYSHGVLYVRWTYGELFIDLSHSRMLHWQVKAVGKKGPERSYSIDVSLPLIHPLTCSAVCRRSELHPSSQPLSCPPTLAGLHVVV